MIVSVCLPIFMFLTCQVMASLSWDSVLPLLSAVIFEPVRDALASGVVPFVERDSVDSSPQNAQISSSLDSVRTLLTFQSIPVRALLALVVAACVTAGSADSGRFLFGKPQSNKSDHGGGSLAFEESAGLWTQFATILTSPAPSSSPQLVAWVLQFLLLVSHHPIGCQWVNQAWSEYLDPATTQETATTMATTTTMPNACVSQRSALCHSIVRQCRLAVAGRCWSRSNSSPDPPPAEVNTGCDEAFGALAQSVQQLGDGAQPTTIPFLDIARLVQTLDTSLPTKFVDLCGHRQATVSKTPQAAWLRRVGVSAASFAGKLPADLGDRTALAPADDDIHVAAYTWELAQIATAVVSQIAPHVEAAFKRERVCVVPYYIFVCTPISMTLFGLFNFRVAPRLFVDL